MLSLITAALLPLLWSSISCSESPPVKVSLRTAWPAPPLLAEIIETAALANASSFFDVAALLAPLGTLNLTPEQTYARSMALLEEAGYLSTPVEISSFELEMSAHKMNPMVVAHLQAAGGATVSAECEDWVEWGTEQVCDLERLKTLVDEGNWPSMAIILPFDHLYTLDTSSSALPALLHHASPSSPTFAVFHAYLMSLPEIRYFLRWAPSSQPEAPPSYLSAWGVGLDLKKTEYSSLDDRLASSSDQVQDDSRPEQESDDVLRLIADMARTNPIASNGESAGTDVESDDTDEDSADKDAESAPVDPKAPLTKDEQLALPLLANEIIFSSSHPLQTLAELARSFPLYATVIARSLAPAPLTYEQILPAGYSSLWLNGAAISVADFNAFNIPRLLRKETELVASLASLGLTPAQASILLSNASTATTGSGEELVTEGRIDVREAEGEEGLVIWWNDVSKDSRYQRWSSNLQGLLRPVYPGSFHPIAANIYNVLMHLDLSRVENLNFIGGYVANLIKRGVPLRMGLVGGGSEDGKKISRAITYLVSTYGRTTAINYMTALLTDSSSPVEGSISVPFARKIFNSLISSLDEEENEGSAKTWDEAVPDVEETADISGRWSTRLGIAGEDGGFVNGRWFPYDDDFLRNMQNECARSLQHLQEQVYYGRITDDDDIATYFYQLPGTMKRRSRYVEPSLERQLVVKDLSKVFSQLGWRSRWIWPAGESDVPLSIWVVVDFNKPEAVALMREALVAMTSDSPFRLSFLPSSAELLSSNTKSLGSLMYHLAVSDELAHTTADDVLRLITGNPHPELHELIEESQRKLLQTTEGETELLPEWLAKGVRATHLLGLKDGDSAIVMNGRVIGPIGPNDFVAADFDALATHELRKRVGPVADGLRRLAGEGGDGLELDRLAFAEILSMASSITSAAQMTDPAAEGLLQTGPPLRNTAYKELAKSYRTFCVGNNVTAIHRFGVILDPVSEHAQRWSALLLWLASLDTVHIEVILNPRIDGTEVPLKRYYRSNLPPRLTFDSHGQEIPPIVQFESLPIEPIYTLAMDTPPSWVVRPRESPYDLDNVFLAALPDAARSAGVEAIFELDYIVAEGHARENDAGMPPRGAQVQITAGINSSIPVDDTMIVANLGYLQLKTQPGVYELGLRSGRTSEIFNMESVGNDGWSSEPVNRTGRYITVTSFEGLTIYPRLKRKKGMERADVLEEAPPPYYGLFDGVLSSLATLLGGTAKTNKQIDTPQAEINIFTVASGLLYERFAFIMTLSVMRHTNRTVKFWFIENFLSPSFLEIIPHVAQEYGFQYELVTYKWPSWLRAQKEKQRVIWAYKILFLDVLFPMDLTKVIFVDADQIVRTDLKELVDLDLHGAPYGYTPMGDDREDMEGFRFWKTGYWQEFLRGKPYHISALYVIDLVRFRQLAAGDRLRAQYQALSADPNSLSNLDQDLPNNMQHDIPIFSLGEDWLWCETWCSADRLSRAKTIDLCQNPLTKEPKLVRARQIPEWEVYDSEIAALTRRLAAEGKIHWTAAMADSDALANVGKASADGVIKESHSHPPEPTDNTDQDEVVRETPRHEEL